jgi:hypothetical protein
VAKVLITYEAEASSLKATVAEVNKANDDVVKSAQESSKKAADAYKQTAQAAAQAFGNGQISGAIKALDKEVTGLVGALKLNVDELKKFDEKAKATNKIIVQSAQDVAKYEDKLRELSLAGKRQTKEFDDIAKAIGEYKSAIIAADRAVDLYAKSTDAATGRIGELEDKLYDLALAGQTNSKEFRELVGEVAKVRRAVIETDAQVDALAQRGSGITGLVQSVELLGAGFQAVEGASALLGDQSEDLQQTLVKLQAIMAVTSAIEQGRVVITEQLAAKTGVLGAATKAYNIVVGTSTGALKAFRVALAATGVGLLVIGIAALVENFDKIKQAAFNSIPGLGQFAQGVTDALDAVKEFFGFVDEQNTDTGVDKFIANEKRKTEAAVNQVERSIKLAQAEGKETFQLEIQKEKILLDFAKRKLAFIDANENQIRQARIDTAQIEFDLQEEIADREVAIRVLQIQNTRKAVAAIETLNSKSLQQVTIKEKQLKLQNDELLGLQVIGNTLATAELDQGASAERRIAIIINEGRIRKKQAQDSIKDQRLLATEIERINAETQAAVREENKKTQEEQLNRAFEIANQISDLFNSLGQLSAQLTENRIAGINEASQAELAAINNSTKTERQKQREREALELRTSRRIAQEKVKQARLDKSLALFNTVISTAEAVMKAGGPFTPIGALTAIAGAAQIALIAARPIPKFAKGGEVGGRLHSQGGTLIEAERGEFVTNRRQTSRHRQELDAINTSTAAFQKLINERYVRPAIQSFMLSGRDKSVTVNASLNSKSMEREIKAMRKSMRKPVVINLSSSDQRYTWQ